MNNRDMKKFLRYLRNNNIVELYENFFDKMFNFDRLMDIDEKDMKEIIACEDVFATIRMYEIINNTTIDKLIKDYILSLDDMELVKYSLRLAVSSSFVNADEKMKYIKAVCESEKCPKYAYAVAINENINSREDGLDYVKMVGNTREDISIFLRDLLYDKNFLKKEEFHAYLEILSNSKEPFIAEYCFELLKDSIHSEHKLSMEQLYVLHCSKGRKQAECAYYVLKNERVMERADSLLIALSIATRDEGYQSEKGLLLTLNEDVMLKADASNIIFDSMNEDVLHEEYNSECTFEELLKVRDLDEIINGLTTISDDEKINNMTKVKVMR